MVLRTRSRARRPALLGLVVAGLLLGLVGMHHLTGPTDTTTMGPGMHVAASEHASSATSEEHAVGHDDLLHLCLAVLTAGVLAAVALLAWPRSETARAGPVGGVNGTTPASRAPPQPVPRRLALLCVLRT